MSSMTTQIRVLRSREEYSMVSAWDELLCVARGSTKPYKLCLGTYEVLASRGEFYDSGEDKYRVPGVINGKPVRCVRDESVLGDDVIIDGYRDDCSFEFTQPAECIPWLEDNDWMDDELIADLHVEVESLVNTQTDVDSPAPAASWF